MKLVLFLYLGPDPQRLHALVEGLGLPGHTDLGDCLLYTSDAADERSSVDLGGRRIIKKKKTGLAVLRRTTAPTQHLYNHRQNTDTLQHKAKNIQQA